MTCSSFLKPKAAMLTRAMMLGSVILGAFLLPGLSSAQTLHPGGALPPAVLVPLLPNLTPKSTPQGAALPTSIDLSQWTIRVGNQGDVGSCTAWAVAYHMLGWYANRFNMGPLAFAPMYVYSQLSGGQKMAGIAPPNTLLFTQTQGMDLASDYPQTMSPDYPWGPYYPFYAYDNLPTPAQNANAANYKIGHWHTLFATWLGQQPYPNWLGNGPEGQAAIQNALANGQPVAISLPIRQGFDNLNATNNLDTDTTTDGPYGRDLHEVLAVGYDQNGLLIQNSWGTSWGNAGFGRLSWDVVQQDVFEAEVIDQDFTTPNTNPTYAITASSGGTVSGSDGVPLTGKEFFPISSALAGPFSVTIRPDPGYMLATIGGTCPAGDLFNSSGKGMTGSPGDNPLDTSYTLNIYSNRMYSSCNYMVTFAPVVTGATYYPVTSGALNIDGSSPISGFVSPTYAAVRSGETMQFTPIPFSGHKIVFATGCNLSGSACTTDPITKNFEAIVGFQ
ncbi:MAG: C1 family peptidase [Burkholderiaceae bacterium]|jgi:hypothetical protein|nr:C1 family peptidase [Burkholderiaceae bacterium]